MKTRTILLSALVAVGALLAGCGGGGESAEAGKGKVEVVSFQGGYGIDFFQAAGKEWGEKEGREVDVWGDPRVWEKLRPRFVAGDVPDLAWPGWGMDYWALVYDDQLKPWDEYLDQDGWRDSFDPGLLKMGMHEGKVYMLPYHVNINGWWYNADLFQANGWEVPTTFDELLALNDKIKAKGLAPITFQGQYPYYMLAGFLYPWIISHGGIEAWNDIQNLKPGAWKSASVLEAARRTQALVQRGDFLRGSMGLNHTDSQAAFYDGKAAMIPCGTWLVSEMAEYAKTMPNGAPKVEFMAVPTLPGGKGDPTAIQVGIEPWVIPAKAKDPAAGAAIFRWMTSPENAAKFTEEKGTLMAVKVADTVKYPPHLERAATVFNASKTKWSADFRQWYPELGKEAENAMAALLNGTVTPEQFAERVEKAAQAVRDNPNIIKHTVE